MKSLSSMFQQLHKSDTAVNIGMFRILFCALTALYYLFLSPVHNYIFETNSYWPPAIGDYYQIYIFGVSGFIWLRYLFVATLLLSAAGLITRPMLAATVFFHFLYEYPIGETYKPYTTNMIFYILIVLALSPGITCRSLDTRWFGRLPAKQRIPNWPFWMIKLILATTYFCSAISKVIGAGLNWFNGQTLQIYMYDRYLAVGSVFSEFASRHIMLCMLISIITFVFESTFWVVLFSRRLTPLYVMLGLGFHIGVYLTFHLNFLWLFCTAYLIFVDWEKLEAKLRRK